MTAVAAPALVAWALPLADWQFYAVTALAAAGCWLALRPFFARRGKKTAASCSNCAAGQARTQQPLVSLGRRSRQ